jgi:hypothetical protein
MSTKTTIHAIRQALSFARIGTFETAVKIVDNADSRALGLYAWNARISAALLAPLHICEVVIRNAVSDAVEKVYGPRWPWQIGFEQSLPSPRTGYNPQRDLQNARSHAPTTGKAIPELKFVFWQKMFTSRHDQRLWEPYLRQILPNLGPSKTVSQLRQEIYDDLEQIRYLRNRIAHHEPVFARNLTNDLEKIVALIAFRSNETAAWMMQNQEASAILRETRTGPSAARIADAAYFLWLDRDGSEGDAEQDWYQAEKQLLGLI